MKDKTTLEYLENLSKLLILPKSENDKIQDSFNVIKKKLVDAFFDDGLREVKLFGSFDRGTLLPRKIDKESDVDILVVFDEKKWVTQTYLTKLKQFADQYYPRSDNYQDHPTIVLELSNIKFELTPCIYKGETTFVYEKYLVPLKENSTIEWKKTEPNALKDKINKFVNTRANLIHLILIFKYWNLKNNSVYKTHEIEGLVIEYFDYEEPLDYNFFRLIDKLSTSNSIADKNALSKTIKKHKEFVEIIVDNKMGEDHILLELRKVLPSLLS